MVESLDEAKMFVYAANRYGLGETRIVISYIRWWDLLNDKANNTMSAYFLEKELKELEYYGC